MNLAADASPRGDRMARYTGPVCRICRRYGEKLMLNGRKTDVPSARTKAGDVIGWTPTGKKTEYFKIARENMSNKHIPGWLNVDPDQMTGRIVSPPAVGETGGKFDPAVIVEYYSR